MKINLWRLKNMNYHINSLPQQPELFYLLELNGLIKPDGTVDINELEKYHGSVIGGYTVDFLPLYNTIIRQDVNYSSLIRKELNSEISYEPVKTEIYGSGRLDYFCLGGNKILINGICSNRLDSVDFHNLENLLRSLKVRSYKFITIEDPFESKCIPCRKGEYATKIRIGNLRHGGKCVHENINFNIIDYYNPMGDFIIPNKLVKCRICGNVFCVCPSEQKFFSDKNLKRPKLCPACREAKRKNDMVISAV